MITIGNFTQRLGNQMFQIAAAYALAKENNDEFLCPKWDYQKYFKLKHKEYKGEEIETSYKEHDFNYNKITYAKNLILDGYFQSYKYSNPEILQELFEFDLDEIKPPYFEEYLSCSIHIRRGDYLKYPNHHPLCSEEYFLKAIDTMLNEYGVDTFYVFSDDIEWCEGFFADKLSRIEGAIFKMRGAASHEMNDFYLMTLCTHNIISNSTFSLMAAMLNKNPNKVVISPSKDNWHGPAYAHWNHDDLIPADWIQIKF